MSEKTKFPERTPEELNKLFSRLYDIIIHLRSPEGCPWDREQTPSSMRSSLIEEAYEVIAAIDAKDWPNFCEELGDMLLIILLMARMAEEEGLFPTQQVFEQIIAKLIRRHPHVFDKKQQLEVSTIIKNWDLIKERLEGKSKAETILSAVMASLPPLEKAYQLQKKAAHLGFDWPSPHGVLPKLTEELEELKKALNQHNQDEIEAEMGDLLFTIVNLCRLLQIDPSLALEKTNRKFKSRFNKIETKLKAEGLSFSTLSLAELDRIWDQIKQEEKANSN